MRKGAFPTPRPPPGGSNGSERKDLANKPVVLAVGAVAFVLNLKGPLMDGRTSLFPIGAIVGTPGVLAVLVQAGMSPLQLLGRHQCGDFGDLCEEDQATNHAAIAGGSRVFSAYVVAPDVRVWVITEADRRVTTLLLPSEY